MQTKQTNIYKAARIQQGITVLKASSLLHISERTLYSYESGDYRPDSDIVSVMKTIYNAPFLEIQHKSNDPIIKEILPEITEQNIAISALYLIDEIEQFNERDKSTLVKISKDGRVTPDEEQDWFKLKQRMFDIIQAFYNVRYAKIQ